MKIPLFVGNSLSLLILSTAIVLAEYGWLTPPPVRIFILIVCWFLVLYFSHCLTHYIVGRLLGVEFDYYFLSSSMLSKANIPLSNIFSTRIFLTLKIRRRATKRKMFIMFLSGPLASMFFPLIVVIIAHGYDRLSSTILALISMANILFTGYFSYKHGCIRKAINSLR
mgnify:CR=1 FL=1